MPSTAGCAGVLAAVVREWKILLVPTGRFGETAWQMTVVPAGVMQVEVALPQGGIARRGRYIAENASVMLRWRHAPCSPQDELPALLRRGTRAHGK